MKTMISSRSAKLVALATGEVKRNNQSQRLQKCIQQAGGESRAHSLTSSVENYVLNNGFPWTDKSVSQPLGELSTLPSSTGEDKCNKWLSVQEYWHSTDNSHCIILPLGPDSPLSNKSSDHAMTKEENITITKPDNNIQERLPTPGKIVTPAANLVECSSYKRVALYAGTDSPLSTKSSDPAMPNEENITIPKPDNNIQEWLPQPGKIVTPAAKLVAYSSSEPDTLSARSVSYDGTPSESVESISTSQVPGDLVVPRTDTEDVRTGGRTDFPIARRRLSFTQMTPASQNKQNEDVTSSLLTPNTSTHESGKRSRITAPRENTRKRKRNTPASTTRKILKNSGQPYISSRGKPMEGAKMRPPCACSKNCVHNMTQDNRTKVFNTFWGLGDHDRQWDFIRQNSVSKETQNGQKRSVHRSYSFTVDGEKIIVCKAMFTATLGISDSWITSAYSHVNPEKGNTVSPGKRGKHGNHRVVYTEDKVATVKQHIATLPRVPSHYCRMRTRREYLEHGLSLSLLARMYSKWAVEMGFEKFQIASKRQYIDIVNGHFNIAFFKPKKDRCKLCVIVTNKKTDRLVRDKYKTTYAAHIQNKIKARELKDRDKKDGIKNPKVAVFSFDLEKQLSCPKSEGGQFYYCSKLKLFNCTFFNMIKRMGLCVMWHEGVGRKGSNEIASAIFLYIMMLHEEGHEDFRLWSDNCAGQNKNRFLFAMYVYLCKRLKIKITHRYLEPGHTQMECDSIHGRIEKASDRKELFDFEEWIQLIESAKVENPKYEVFQLKTSDILCFKDLVAQQNWSKDLQGRAIKWTKVKEITVDGTEQVTGLVRLKYDLANESYVTLNVNKAGNVLDLASYHAPQAYQSAIPISARTVQDLQSLLKDNSIPEYYHAFYKHVLDGTTPSENDGSEKNYETDEELCEGEVLEDLVDELRRREDQEPNGDAD